MDASLRWATRFNTIWLQELRAHSDGVYLRVGLYFGAEQLVPGTVVWVCAERTARVGSLFRATCNASNQLCVESPWGFTTSVRLLAAQQSKVLSAEDPVSAHFLKINWQGESWARSAPVSREAVLKSVVLAKPRPSKPRASGSGADDAAEASATVAWCL